MPLPSRLVDRLAERGLCVASPLKPIEKVSKRDFRGVIGCPNKSNIFHECTHWCEVHWKPCNIPEPKYMQNVGKLVQKYPLPPSWTEIFDRGLKRYYFWDMETDYVCWLPPLHPKAKPSKSAAKKREKRLKRTVREDKAFYKLEDSRDKRRSKASRKSHSRKDHSEKRLKYEDKKSRKKSKRNYIDPMDPAAYSNIPIGSWSDGLEFKKPESIDTFSANRTKKSTNFGVTSYQK